jgi:putative NADH-flavin reductase
MRGGMHAPMPSSTLTLAVLGATGRTGRRLVEYALADGHAVRALARAPAALDALAHPRLTVHAGDARDPDAVDALIAGTDAVASALGGGTLVDPGTARSEGARLAAAAMTRHGVARFVGVAGGGILDLPGVGLRNERPDYPAVFRQVTREHLATWIALRDTGLAWTLACTGDIVPGERTGAYRVLPDLMPDGGRRISVEDLADFLLRELTESRFVGRRVGAAY